MEISPAGHANSSFTEDPDTEMRLTTQHINELSPSTRKMYEESQKYHDEQVKELSTFSIDGGQEEKMAPTPEASSEFEIVETQEQDQEKEAKSTAKSSKSETKVSNLSTSNEEEFLSANENTQPTQEIPSQPTEKLIKKMKFERESQLLDPRYHGIYQSQSWSDPLAIALILKGYLLYGPKASITKLKYEDYLPDDVTAGIIGDKWKNIIKGYRGERSCQYVTVKGMEAKFDTTWKKGRKVCPIEVKKALIKLADWEPEDED